MNKWIEELIDSGVNFLNGNGALYEDNDKRELTYYPPNSTDRISLEGTFTIQQLQALANHMNKYNKEEE
jgi:hypothetical protein